MANIFDQFDTEQATPPAAVAPRASGNVFDQFDAPAAPPPQRGGAFKPFGELKAADPSWTQWLKWKAQEGLMALGASPQVSQHLSSGAVDAGNALIPPMGSVLAGADASYNAIRGNYGDAAIDAAGAVPGLLALRRGAQAVRGTLPTVRMADTPTSMVNPATGARNDELLNSAGRAYDRIAQAPIEYHPNAIADYAQRAKYILQQPGARGVFTPESAPGVFGLLDRRVAELRARGVQSLSPTDFETLRQQLKGFTEGADSAAGQRAASILENYMHNPPPGAITAMAPGAMDTLRADQAIARGDWRAGKTAQAVEQEIDRAGTKAGTANSGLNADNKTRSALVALTTTDAGANKIFGATYPERQAIDAVGAGDPVTNWQRAWGNRLGGGGGLGNAAIGTLAGSAGTALGTAMGLDPYTAMAMGTATGIGTAKAGGALRSAATERTVSAADDVVDMIRRNSPMYQAREAANPPITDPTSMMRDAVTYALMPQAAAQGQNLWDQAHAPYESDAPPVAPDAGPRRVYITPQDDSYDPSKE